MKPIKVVTPVLGDPDAPTQVLVGLGALAGELAAEGISVRDLFARSGVDASQLEDAHARISHRQRLMLYRNAKRLAKRSDVGLLHSFNARQCDFRCEINLNTRSFPRPTMGGANGRQRTATQRKSS